MQSNYTQETNRIERNVGDFKFALFVEYLIIKLGTQPTRASDKGAANFPMAAGGVLSIIVTFLHRSCPRMIQEILSHLLAALR